MSITKITARIRRAMGKVSAAAVTRAAVALAAAWTVPAQAQLQVPTSIYQRVQIADPYIEMRTGAGRGYPVFHVAARGETVELVLRHTDWYKVRTARGIEGWVTRSQLETTLTEAGEKKTFRDVLVDDYLKRRVEMGAAWGQFKRDPMLKLFVSYRMSETLALEATLGQVQGVFSGTDFWHVNLVAEPWSDQRWSPVFGIGFGKFKNIPNTTLVGAIPTDANLANATLGLRYHVNDRFVVRGDYTLYTAYVEDARSTEYRAWTLGFSFFF
ncbi:MAG TPA: SH3 domain-containing protein [Methylibium sp.]|uniref:SH3 domain-containing protein n=1 Tax=Methylibium sp. TaxID=2067992 RepID=UPI002DBCCEB2|nr:SH3 domain-containing protein [Methylibium sp.]HEU4459176.1 SH3 domain-containing protein [Methylibium sp.]